MEPKIKKSRSYNKISNIATLDNGTMVETLKYLNYMQLAKSSLVAKRFSNLFRTHRQSLALLHVEYLSMDRLNYTAAAAVKIFNNELSSDAYAEWVVHNRYSNKIRVVKMQYSNKFYEMKADCKDSNQYPNGSLSVFYERNKLNHKNWPLFQHFVRLLTDPFVYFRYLKLIPQIDVSFLNLLAGSINPCHNRLQCGRLDFYLQGNVQKLLGWIKDYVHCNELRLYQSVSNYDQALLDFFVTGAHCTSEIYFSCCDISTVIVAFLQKFMDLKSCDENQMIESIRCYPTYRIVEVLKSNYAKFIVKEEKCGDTTVILFEFFNNDVGKQLQITTTTTGIMTNATYFLLEIKNL